MPVRGAPSPPALALAPAAQEFKSNSDVMQGQLGSLRAALEERVSATWARALH